MPEHEAVHDLIVAARARQKAEIGLPPDVDDTEANMAFFIGTTSDFEAEPVPFDTVIHRGETMSELPGTTEQTLGLIDDQLVLQITVPDLPGAADVIDEIADAAQIGAIIGTWALSRHFKKIARNRVILEVQKLRLLRAQRVAAAFRTGDRRRFRAVIRSAKIGRSVAKRTTKGAQLVAKARKVRFIATRVGAKVLFKVVGGIGLAIDVVLVSHRTFKGAERGGAEGAVAGFVAGVADVLTLGLAEKQTDILEVKTESFVTKLFVNLRKIGKIRFGS